MGRVETWGDDNLTGVYVLSKLIKLYNLDMSSLSCVDRTSTKLLKEPGAEPSGLHPRLSALPAPGGPRRSYGRAPGDRSERSQPGARTAI